jgi:hypothetical protein
MNYMLHLGDLTALFLSISMTSFYNTCHQVCQDNFDDKTSNFVYFCLYLSLSFALSLVYGMIFASMRATRTAFAPLIATLASVFA